MFFVGGPGWLGPRSAPQRHGAADKDPAPEGRSIFLIPTGMSD